MPTIDLQTETLNFHTQMEWFLPATYTAWQQVKFACSAIVRAFKQPAPLVGPTCKTFAEPKQRSKQAPMGFWEYLLSITSTPNLVSIWDNCRICACGPGHLLQNWELLFLCSSLSPSPVCWCVSFPELTTLWYHAKRQGIRDRVLCLRRLHTHTKLLHTKMEMEVSFFFFT